MGVLQTDASQGSSGTASGAGSETVSGPFSLVRGGPIYRLWRRVGLVRHDGPDALRIGLALVVISWVPVMLIALLERAFTGRWPLLVLELSVQARLLIAVPLLAVAEEWADALTRGAMQYLSDAKIMTHEPELQRISASAARMRDSWIGELVLLLAAFATTYGAVWGFGPWRDAAQPPVASTWSATGNHLQCLILQRDRS